MNNKVISVILLLCSLSPTLFSREKIKIKTPEKGWTPESIVANINETYEYNMQPYNSHDEIATLGLFRDPMYCRAEKAIQKYFSKHKIERKCNMIELEEYMYENMTETSAKQNATDELLRKAILYHITGFTEHRALAYETIARCYANKLDLNNLHQVLFCFEHSDINKTGKYDEKIKQLRDEFSELITSNDISLQSQGVWVSDLHTKQKHYGNFPYSIININNLTRNDGIQSLNLPSFDNVSLVPQTTYRDFSLFRESQGIAGQNYDSIGNGLISVRFGSQQFRQGMDVSSGFEQTRQFQANMAGTIAASNASWGTKMGLTAATSLAGGLMNMAFVALSQSSMEVASMNVNFYPNINDRNMMNSHVIHYHYKVTTNSRHNPKPVTDEDVAYLRWLPEDSVYFVNRAGGQNNIFSVTPTDKLDLTEYEQIYKKEKLKNRLIGGCIIGSCLALIAAGLSLSLPEINKDTASTGKIIGGSVLVGVGSSGIWLIPYIVNLFKNKVYNSDPYKELNRKQLEKLRNKRQATLSISPIVNPVQQAAGMSATLTY